MLPCGHERAPFGSPICVHLRTRREPWFPYMKWYTGSGFEAELICDPWDCAMAWLDDRILAVSKLGDDGSEMFDGARIFDVTETGDPGENWRTDWKWAREILAFPGPAGLFFSDGVSLFSSDETGMSRWDPTDGARTGHLAGFRPTHHHRRAGELAAVVDGMLVRWRTSGLS